MSTPFIGEVRLFGGSFAPVGWAFCDGRLLPISEYEALFNLIGTTYGGDGQQTFGLPNLGGRVPMHNGNGLVIGEMSGSETVTLNSNQMATHGHLVGSTGQPGTAASPGGAIMADQGPAGLSVLAYQAYDIATQVVINPNMIGFAGGSQPHENMQPYLTITFIIALYGIYPSQG